MKGHPMPRCVHLPRSHPRRLEALAASAALGVVAIGAGAGPPAWAASGSGGAGFTVAGGPTGDLTLPTGQVVAVDFTVINSSDRPEQINVAITGLHFNGQTPEFTGSPSPGLTVTASTTSLTLAAQASQGVNLSVEAAAGSKPGGLYAGVVFKEIPPASQGSTTVEEAQARPLIGHVPGPTSDTGQIRAFASPVAVAKPNQVVFDLTFLDTGDIDYRLGGTMGLVTVSGAPVGTMAVPADTVLPGNPRVIPLAYTGTAPVGQLTGQLHLTWGTTAEHSGTAMATVLVSDTGTSSGGPGGGGGPNGNHQNVTIFTRHGSHPVSWLFKGLALLLLLIIIALLIRRYLQRRRNEKRLRAQA
ncbi:MAG TPA: hypothetical protein VNF50_09470 [Acidimicrobiales bacterium]|nr:hypothetical protein [Acidimicrobiales bacterium]